MIIESKWIFETEISLLRHQH